MDVCCFVSQVFEVYEPLRLIYRNSDNETKLQVLQAPLSCVLTPKTVWKLYERTCPTLLTCEPPLEQVEELGHKCKHCFSGTVVKVLPHRIPGGKLSSFLPVFTYRAVGVSIIACCSRPKSKYKFQDKTGMVSRVQSYKIYENGWKLL